ncbi:Alpha/Beta hydrolase protein [Xylariaceae sp. FL0804]|nr:Alpha/Beta hydrolase protein [Xylariaceae sp. FL0804]
MARGDDGDSKQGPIARVSTMEPPPLDEDYVNPADKSPRWLLAAHAYTLRLGAHLGFSLGNWSGPAAPSPAETLWLDATLSEWKGRNKISASVWLPPAATSNNKSKSKSSSSGPESGPESESSDSSSSPQPPPPPPPGRGRGRPAVINFHGGGFILGQGTDDARWAAALCAELGAVVFSVNYRLAPSYPFPTPVEDCVDAVAQIAALAPARYGVDPDRVLLSGFSAGGTLATSSWVVLQDPARWGYELPVSSSSYPPSSSSTSAATTTNNTTTNTSSSSSPSPLPAGAGPTPPPPPPPPKIAGLVLFYPLLDWTVDRPTKRAASKRPDQTLPSGLTDLIDASYLHPPRPRRERDDVRLSPGLMPDELVARLPPLHLCLCDHDMLLAEGRLFADRARELRGARGPDLVSVRVVEGEKHAWDKPLPLAPKENVGVEYAKAVEAIKTWFDGGEQPR